MRLFTAILLFFGLLWATDVTAQLQYETDNRRRGDSPIWYGAGAQLGFSGGDFQRFFTIGVSPIVGYKVTNFLSFGPRLSIAYNSYRFDPSGGRGATVQKADFWTGSAGVFGRALIFRGIFAHAEYSLSSEVLLATDNTGTLTEVRNVRGVPWLGAGLQQGGGPGNLGFEILLLFRVTQPDRLNDQPFELRTGVNYNF